MLKRIREQDKVNEKDANLYASYIDQILNGKNENDIGYRKLSLEISHVAKFLSRLEDRIEIIKKTEKPDFILSKNSQLVGLEHEILINKEYKKTEGSFEDLISTVEKEYRNKYPSTKKLLNIYLNSNLRFRKANKDHIVKELMSIIEHYVKYESLIENDFIDDIFMMNHSKLGFNCNLGAWWQKNLVYNDLKDAIRKKEKKISEYIENSGIKEQWLLIVIGSLKESSYEIDSLESLNGQIDTKFDKVFILEDFRANLYELISSQ